MHKLDAIKIIRNCETTDDAALKLIGGGCDVIEANYFLNMYGDTHLGREIGFLSGENEIEYRLRHSR